MGTPHHIEALGQSEVADKENNNRIKVLADARNKAIEPLYSGTAARTMPGGIFHEVLFMNDVHFCLADILEVIYQKRVQGANQACAMDWGGQVVYDRWIIRTMTGRYD
jgi:alpha-1,3-mannosyltransferase